jgi:ribonuclease PH
MRGIDSGALLTMPLNDSVAAVSVGVVGGMPVLDLEYREDCVADVDMNVVMTGSGRIIEVQATAETTPFDRPVLDQLLDLAETGIRQMTSAQLEVAARSYERRN